ncbi:hypothetical protein GC425_01165 [Corynebacterium sp. zg254]|uniref:Cell wall hydrolase n=1 Tax=Corynebacterium zhongnanshanii TaxID=2768834 RepID=A0ABQ6VGE7_9CORY|nr:MULTISPECIES: hypothetical protein [Corynebacterium]KAB3523393.1 hypothetical protein F8377_04465 [Corynebacterium zhongnanshanii]MCR5913481.1 hypothetical protein [Corynebacterium sp. zg254]
MTTSFTQQVERRTDRSAARRAIPGSIARLDLDMRVQQKPMWDEHQASLESNTAGAGRAVAPSRSLVSRRRRIAATPHTVFEYSHRHSLIQRVMRRADMVARSRGGVAVSLGAIVLALGLSPVFWSEEPAQPQPAPVVEHVSIDSNAGDISPR